MHEMVDGLHVAYAFPLCIFRGFSFPDMYSATVLTLKES